MVAVLDKSPQRAKTAKRDGSSGPTNHNSDGINENPPAQYDDKLHDATKVVFASGVSNEALLGALKNLLRTSTEVSEQSDISAVIRGVMASMNLVADKTRDATSQLAAVIRDSGLRLDEQALALALATLGVTNYENQSQYHAADHALNVAADLLQLQALVPEFLNQSLSEKFARVLRAVATGAYHDTGNSRHPSNIAGADETAAVRIFLADVALAHDRNIDANKALILMDADNIMQVAANIAATVISDRFASADCLENKPYLADIAKELKEFGAKVGMQFGVDDAAIKVDLAQRMAATEAALTKNADLIGSLKPENALRNHILNREEDQEKPGLGEITDPTKYFESFITFMTGGFHHLENPEDLGSHDYLRALQFKYDGIYKSSVNDPTLKEVETAIRADPRNGPIANEIIKQLHTFSAEHGWTPSVLVGDSKEVSAYGNKLFREAQVYTEAIINERIEVLTRIHELIKSGVDLPRLSIDQLSKELAGIDLSKYPTLKNPDNDLKSRILADLTPSELNKLFDVTGAD